MNAKSVAAAVIISGAAKSHTTSRTSSFADVVRSIMANPPNGT
jgi:hypothetical protein